ncbi:MAG: hypothetical protein R2809_11040 [Flavobacteriales bacterium]
MIERTYSWGNELVSFNSTSPDGRFYYQIQKPKDMYWGLFVAKISFLNNKNEVIYYEHDGGYADPIQITPESKIKYANYSKCGDFVYFRRRRTLNQLSHVVINLVTEELCEVEWSQSNEDQSFALKHQAFNFETVKIFEEEYWQKFVPDKRKDKNFIGMKLWHP